MTDNKNKLFAMVGEKKTGKSLHYNEDTILFHFWKNNRKDQEYTLSLKEFREKYLEWLKTKEKSWLEYYGFNIQSMQFFIGDEESKKGLQSVGDLNDSEKQWELLQDVRVKYFLEENIK